MEPVRSRRHRSEASPDLRPVSVSDLYPKQAGIRDSLRNEGVRKAKEGVTQETACD